MSHLISKIVQNNIKKVVVRHNNSVLFVSCRNLNIIPSIYDGDQDPAPKFFSPKLQLLLKNLTRPDVAKVFRKRTNSNIPVLKTPKYKFLTSKELETELAKANYKAKKLLMMPPVVKVNEPMEIISRDPALIGYDTCKYMFTDITFGVKNAHRLIIERDPDGVLRSCDQQTRKRLNQVYFPLEGRKIKEPLMFSDMEKLNSLLEREKYEFILDRACIQYEPDEPAYQKINSITYQHVDSKSLYDLLRSTRHFGPLVFYLIWHQHMDGLMLELLQTNHIREAVLLVAARQAIREDVSAVNSEEVAQKILAAPQQTNPADLTDEDIKLDNSCIEVVEKYVVSNSAMRGKQELALQGFREHYQQLVDLRRGLRKAHGVV